MSTGEESVANGQLNAWDWFKSKQDKLSYVSHNLFVSVKRSFEDNGLSKVQCCCISVAVKVSHLHLQWLVL